MNSSYHVSKLEFSILEGANRLAKLMPALHIFQCHICAEFSTANAAAGYIDPPTIHYIDTSLCMKGNALSYNQHTTHASYWG